MISTHKFSLTPKQLFRVILIHRFSKLVWYILPFFTVLFVIVNWPMDENFEIFFLSFVIFLPAIMVISLWMYANNETNKIFYRERYDEYYADKIVSYLSDGSSSSTMLTNITHHKEKPDYYLLFISREQFFYIPKSAFKTKEDQEWFEEVVLMRFKNKN